MKPIIIIMDKNKTFSKEELEKLIEDAYESGYEDGRRSVNISIPDVVPTYPQIYPWNEPYYRQPWWSKTTCATSDATKVPVCTKDYVHKDTVTTAY